MTLGQGAYIGPSRGHLGRPNLGKPVFARFDAPSGPPQMNYLDMLALDPATPVGAQVVVTDRFTVSGFGDGRDGDYFYSSEQSAYLKGPWVGDDNDWRIRYE